MKLLVDNNLPPVLGRGLGALFAGRHEVAHIKDKFGRGNLPDVDWIEALGAEGGWCVLSGDRNIAKKRPSREAFLGAGLIGFFPLPAVMSLPLHRQAARILTLWPTIEATALVIERGCFELGISGSKLRQMS
ncbi:MAG: hypothetical protein JNM03_11050 [Sphingopyxis sp.]|uniref:PIN-like domain-containing protein n=1 Tax=Sphingopyxis sp. TaxID=1908224 RepID=UPI001A3F58A4|nr:hypothetical protein [Sphingopyxis sp.]MBL9070511.1 hypothetical protein [Sphingopyxis sp.]